MSKAQILIVEDETIIAKDIQNSLLNLGYSTVGIASAGTDAIEIAKEKKPDLILMDIMLRGNMDGIDTANRIKEHFNIPVIFCSAYFDQNTLERAKITEPFGYMIKPFEERELNITIEMALYKHKMEIELRDTRELFITTLKSINDGIISTDTNGRVAFVNPVALSLTGLQKDEVMGKRPKDILNIKSAKTGKPIECPIDKALKKNAATLHDIDIMISKDNNEMQIEHSSTPIRNDNGDISGVVMAFRDITERAKIEKAREKLILNLQKALSQIKTLSGLLPICASCKKIRDDRGYWNQIESYIHKHSDAEFTHSICPDCSKRLYPELECSGCEKTEQNV